MGCFTQIQVNTVRSFLYFTLSPNPVSSGQSKKLCSLFYITVNGRYLECWSDKIKHVKTSPWTWKGSSTEDQFVFYGFCAKVEILSRGWRYRKGQGEEQGSDCSLSFGWWLKKNLSGRLTSCVSHLSLWGGRCGTGSPSPSPPPPCSSTPAGWCWWRADCRSHARPGCSNTPSAHLDEPRGGGAALEPTPPHWRGRRRRRTTTKRKRR